MNALTYLFHIASATLFTFTASLFTRFIQFPFQPYSSVVITSRLLRTHHLTTIALVASSFLVFALFAPGTGFGGVPALQKIWQLDKREIEILYLILFVIGSTVLTIMGGTLFGKLLHITRKNRRLFTDVFNVFIAFTLLWFIVLAALTTYISSLFKIRDWVHEHLWLGPEKSLAKAFEALLFTDVTVSKLLVSPALWISLALSSYFGFLMIMRWSLRRNILNIVGGKEAQKAFSHYIILMLATAATAFFFIVVPALYLAVLSSTLLKRATVPDFAYRAYCYIADNKLQRIAMVVTNNTSSRIALTPIFIVGNPGTILELNHGDMFWMSRKGLYFDPSETRYYRLELTPPIQFSATECAAKDKKPGESKTVHVSGDSYSVVPGSSQTK